MVRVRVRVRFGSRQGFGLIRVTLNVCRIFLCTDRELEPGTEQEIRTRLDGFTNRIPEAPESLRGEKKYRGLLT